MSIPDTNLLMQLSPYVKSSEKCSGWQNPKHCCLRCGCRIFLCTPWSLWSPQLWSYSDVMHQLVFQYPPEALHGSIIVAVPLALMTPSYNCFRSIDSAQTILAASSEWCKNSLSWPLHRHARHRDWLTNSFVIRSDIAYPTISLLIDPYGPPDKAILSVRIYVNISEPYLIRASPQTVE